jgi:serine/threonine protein kinase
MVDSNLLGKVVLGYTVTEILGSGAFGTVYKAVKKNPAGEYVRALKHIVIPSEKQYESVLNSMGGDLSKVDDYFSEMLKNIVTEIQILNDLSEKGVQNIVRYYENDIISSESPKRYNVFILMEYLTPLLDYTSKHDFTVNDVVRLGLDVLTALKLCHENNIIHRDIKDDNIFVAANKEFKIGDFGVSKILKGSSRAESMKGTPNFLAPEVYLGKESYTKSVDLYSLGIVLYRLLNYNRNPFLPKFPETYSPNDENLAFEERMKGLSPPLPYLSGAAIGNVVVKSISDKDNRFFIAEEFYTALEIALKNTEQEVLDTKTKVVSMPSPMKNTPVLDETVGEAAPFIIEEINKERTTVLSATTGGKSDIVFTETIGESSPITSFNSTLDDEVETSNLHSGLFNTIGEKYNPPVPEIISDTPCNAPTPNITTITTPPLIEENDDEFKVLDSEVIKKTIYIVPAVLALIGIVLIFVLPPAIYGKAISIIDWLFSNPQEIIDTLRNPNSVFATVYWFIGLRIATLVWLISFIASLFFMGRQLQAKPKPDAINAILSKKEPYLIMQEIHGSLKSTKQRRSGIELDALIRNIKKLEEKLSIESDFGYGKTIITNCENNIAKQLQFLQDVVISVEVGNLNENIEKMNSAIANINNLLVRRRELKKI